MMTGHSPKPMQASALACSNIAFIKYWGDRDPLLRLPVNNSISMNLEGLNARTTVEFKQSLNQDQLILNEQNTEGPALTRVSQFLARVRQLAGLSCYARVTSTNNFPLGAGMASSAAAFAALSLAAAAAAGLNLDEPHLSALARRGSGSASRSVPAGFVEWQAGSSDNDSYAFSIAGPQHWDLVDCVAVVAAGPKTTGSTEGHAAALSSPLQHARVADSPRRLQACRQAILTRDFEKLASVVEEDSNQMHAVMMTSHPPLFYWKPASLALMQVIPLWRSQGLAVCYTLDAGPNVHVIGLSSQAAEIEQKLRQFEGVEQVFTARPGGPARLVLE